MKEYTASEIKTILKELNITPYKTNRVDGQQAAKILTWRLKQEQDIEHVYTTTALRKRVDTGALPVVERVNPRFNLYDVRDVFALSLVPNRAEGTRQRISNQQAKNLSDTL
jgi:hypothetical protein